MFNKKPRIVINHKKAFLNGELESDFYTIELMDDGRIFDKKLKLEPKDYEELKVKLAQVDNCK